MSKFTLKKRGEIIAENVVNIDLGNFEYNEKVKKFEYEVLEGLEKIISFEGIQIFFGELSTDGPINFEINFDKPTFNMTFEIEGGCIFKYLDSENKESSYELSDNHYNCVFLPRIVGSMEYTCEKRKYFTILISKDYIYELFKTYFRKTSDEYCGLMDENKEFKLFKESRVIALNLHKIINQIIECYFVEEIKETYIKSKMIDFFSYIFSSLRESNDMVKKEDERLAERAYKYVVENYKKDISLDSISREIGTNKTKLKRVFKEVYKETVFEFRLRYKMEIAKEMLKENTVSDVAFFVGYKNPQHFSTAFKNEYGCCPSAFKMSFRKGSVKITI